MPKNGITPQNLDDDDLYVVSDQDQQDTLPLPDADFDALVDDLDGWPSIDSDQ